MYPCHGKECWSRVLYGRTFKGSVCATAEIAHSSSTRALTDIAAKLSVSILHLSILVNVVSHKLFQKQGLNNLHHALTRVDCAGQLWELLCSNWRSWSTWLLCGCDTGKLLGMRKALSFWKTACLFPCLLCSCGCFSISSVAPFGC